MCALPLQGIGSVLVGNYLKARAMHSVAFVTCPNASVADSIAGGLVSEKLAACVNIVPSVQSVYTWEGKVTRDNEVLLIIKTRSSLADKLNAFVKAHHPYECPEVISMKIESGYPPYLNWISESTVDS
ncbi:unnamed protein product [Calicophoron daubneyi]|uniref:Uncharacterized protein n=1 Tax=Calicophoron daubneyi TaxID=300641 RepID=A0AAV2U0L6_CALDB